MQKNEGSVVLLRQIVYRWNKEQRIRKRPDFSRCYNEGKKIHGKYFIVFIVASNTQAQSRIGLAVTKKMGNAVMRNRLKRLLREFCRLHYLELPAFSEIVITPKKHLRIALCTFTFVENELLHLFKSKFFSQ